MKKIGLILVGLIVLLVVGSFETSSERTLKPPGIEIVQQDIMLSNNTFDIIAFPAVADMYPASFEKIPMLAESPPRQYQVTNEGVLFQLKFLINTNDGTLCNLPPETTTLSNNRYICLGYSIWS